MTIVVNKDGYIPLEYFKEMLDISKVAWYAIKVRKDESLVIKFYDKRRKLIKIKGLKNDKSKKS
jgi:hypothetical protein